MRPITPDQGGDMRYMFGPTGSLKVHIDWGARCTTCQLAIVAGETAVLRWTRSLTELVHESCA